MAGRLFARPWQSNIPGALTALVALVETAVAEAGADVLVKDGMWTSAETADVIAIGWAGFVPGYQYPSRSMSEELATPAVTSVNVQEGLAPSIREQFSISCSSICRVGSESIPDARSRAYGNAALVGQVVAPPWLGTNVIKATMAATTQLHEIQDRRGALAIVTFSIECDAYSQQ